VQERIRNFCIIAHIDHGKSTIADRLLELTGTLPPLQSRKQVLDDMELEQERGITIKAHPVAMTYRAADGHDYRFNLIDTPGHVDFAYEVSRSLAACEGALLVVDAAQGVEAQTLANLYAAVAQGLEIIPVVNKIDLPGAQTEQVVHQIVDLIGCDEEDVLLVSAKSGLGCDHLLEEIVRRVPAPKGDPAAPFRALIFDSLYDNYRGSVSYVRVVDGEVAAGTEVRSMHEPKDFLIDEVGTLTLKRVPGRKLVAGEVGYVILGTKDVKDARVGDTLTLRRGGSDTPLEGYAEVKPMVFSGLYPVDASDYEELRDALAKLCLNDSALVYTPETSLALGFGFRCGFLGLLHMEIVQERLDREYDLDIITTMPNVEYLVKQPGREEEVVDNPADFPRGEKLESVREPFIKATIITPTEFIGNIMKLAMERRGIYKSTEYLDTTRATLVYEFPLGEIVFDFYDRLKTMSKGYASYDYELLDFRASALKRLDIMINGEPVDSLSMIVHMDKAWDWGNKMCIKLKELIPRQLFEVAIQGALGTKVISRTTVKAMRKNVTAKCYGGDISRKRKLLEKQKEGKKRMKQVGTVEIPQEAFLAMLKIER
jgi:GTP-binding protein LepA